MKLKESYLNIKEKYDSMMGVARDLKKEIIDEIMSKLTTVGESHSVYISSMYIAEKGGKPERAIICNLKVNKALKIGKNRIMILSTDEDNNEFEYDIKELTVRECMNVLQLLNIEGGCRPIPMLDMIARDDEDEGSELGPGEDIFEEQR